MIDSQLTVEDFTVSKNDKTEKSANFDLATCRPTKYCYAHCYARGRNQEQADSLGSTPNGGPITWKLQAACYVKNVEVVKAFVLTGRVHELAERIVKQCAKIEIDGEVRRHIRWNGCGDLFPEVLPLIIALAEHGVRVWGFSRKPELIEELGHLADSVGLTGWTRPYFQGSIDMSVPPSERWKLIEATIALNGHAALAAAADTAMDAMWLDSKDVATHFGYHTNLKKTKLGTAKECPATAGEHVKCEMCLRCFGLEREQT